MRCTIHWKGVKYYPMKKNPIGIKPNTQNEQYRGIKMSTHQHINLATKSINLITYVLTLQKEKEKGGMCWYKESWKAIWLPCACPTKWWQGWYLKFRNFNLWYWKITGLIKANTRRTKTNRNIYTVM